MSSNKPLNILVLAVGGNVSQGILKALAISQLPCRIIGADISALQMGLHTVDIAYVSPWANDPSFINWLIHTCNIEKIDIILTGCEPILRPLALHKETIESKTNAVCFVNTTQIIQTCDDKYLTCEWLKSQGFPYPAYAATDEPEKLNKLAERYGYPLLAKPRIGGGSHGVMLLEDQWDLEYISRKENYIVQEFLGDAQSEYTVGCFHDRNGKLCGSIVLWRELLLGTTYRARAGVFPEVQSAAENISSALKPLGPCNIQMRMTQNGPVCFEINPRFSGTTPLRARLGFNEVLATIQHFLSGFPPPAFPKVTSGTVMRYWNEVYAKEDTIEALETNSKVINTPETKGIIETYGMEHH